MHLGNWANIATHFLHQRTVSVVGSIIVRLAGLQVNWIGFDETRKSVVIWLHWTTETGDKLFSGLSPFIECYLHRYIKEFNAQSLDKSKLVELPDPGSWILPKLIDALPLVFSFSSHVEAVDAMAHLDDQDGEQAAETLHSIAGGLQVQHPFLNSCS